MRDARRISEVLDSLRQVWEQHPDLRLGQLLVIAARPKEPCPELFHIEDQALLAGLAQYRAHSVRSVPEEAEAVLGVEYDSALFERLSRFVARAGGHISETSYGVGGSQELITYEIVLPAGKLILVSETYAGLSIRGPAALVQDVAHAVRSA